MEPMVEDLMMDRGQMWMIPLGMKYSWTHWIGEAVDTGIILVLAIPLTGIFFYAAVQDARANQ